MNQSIIQLFKCRVQGKNGKFYDNLYLRINEGGYFQIIMRFFNSNVWHMLLKNAVEVTPDVVNGGKSYEQE